MKSVKVFDVKKQYDSSPAAIEKVHELMLAAKRIVFFYPAYWGSMMPGFGKTFVDEVFTEHFAYNFDGSKP